MNQRVIYCGPTLEVQTSDGETATLNYGMTGYRLAFAENPNFSPDWAPSECWCVLEEHLYYPMM